MTTLQTNSMPRMTSDPLMALRKASRSDLRRMARNHDWSDGSEAALGWMMAQKGMDLSTALTVFFNGDPARFNYLPKTHVPEDHHGVSILLDNICLRINSGFYRAVASQKLSNQQRLDRWLNFQAADRVDGRRGRWILDENIVQAVVRPVEKADNTDEVQMLGRLQDVSRPTRTPPRALTSRVLIRLSQMIPSRRPE